MQEIKSGEWTQLAYLNIPRMFHSSITIGSKVYVIAGMGESSSLLSSIEWFEHTLYSSGSW